MKKVLFIFFLFPLMLFAEGSFVYLKDNLKNAVAGDYLVTQQNQNYTVMIIKAKTDETITLEEVTVPSSRKSGGMSWKEWVERRAPGHTCWVMYTINASTGKMMQYYSYTNETWYDMSQANNFLSQLLSLKLNEVAYKDRKRTSGIISKVWQPALIFEGKEVPQVSFNEYEAHWPKDSSELSDKTITVYLPEASSNYPSYFPYWLQVRGFIGKARVRTVDSGRNLKSPMKVEK